MAFTANEMVTAIHNNGPIDGYMEDRFERASFAEFLASQYGAMYGTAEDMLYDLAHSTTWYEDGPVSTLYRDLMEYRESA